jgi:hypothetical protein
VALINPKYPHNGGATLPAGRCRGVRQRWWTGDRLELDLPRGELLPREERMMDQGNVEMFQDDRVLDRFAAGG